MKITIATTPIRPKPTNFPPFGSLALIKYLRMGGYDDIDFYHIDGNRPKYEEVLKYFETARPDVVGISAVVSTAYEYSKRLSIDIKNILPDSFIVLGGNMGASANVLLRKTGVDLVVLGEGEAVFLDVMGRLEQTRNLEKFRDITGLVYLDSGGKLVNTGYREQIPQEEMYDLDWEDLARAADINIYFPRVSDPESPTAHFDHDQRFFDPDRINKTMGYLYTSKGCVSKCTFCHRWDKGIRFIPVDIVMRRLDEIIEKYDLGFLYVADENFGTDKRWLEEFCAEIKKRNILFSVGTRAKGVTVEGLGMLKESGCTDVTYGNETGSERMLQIMEKKVSIDDNYNAVKWAIDVGMNSIVQLVCGMPGETPDTIAETIEFCKVCNSVSPNQNPNDLSINYAQALPGTPLYEHARAVGLIGKTLEQEESYLLAISDRDAHDETVTLNFTDYPKLTCETWRPLITIEVNYHYVKKYGLDQYFKVIARDTDYFDKPGVDTGYYANPKRLMDTLPENGVIIEGEKLVPPSLWSLIRRRQYGLAIMMYPLLAHRFRFLLPFLVIIKNIKLKGVSYSMAIVMEWLRFRLKNFNKKIQSVEEYKSLRKIVQISEDPSDSDSAAMVALRKGR